MKEQTRTVQAKGPLSRIQDFLQLEASSGVLLLGAAVVAMLIENSSLDSYYDALLETPAGFHLGAFSLSKPLLLWINDGLMAVFFFLVGLEIKREFVKGELAEPSRVVLPACGAVGGMLIPALIYFALNYHDPLALKGWAIPCATDIAFALGVLSALGRRVPASLKVFLLTLAILDDLGAIIIIALFYTADLSVKSLGVAGVILASLLVMNLAGVRKVSFYIIAGVLLWVAVLKSGVHATLAGVVLAMFIPLHGRKSEPILEKLEHDLHPIVAFIILPLFAFANSGVSLAGLSPGVLFESVPLGIVLGLVLGKQIGVMTFAWGAVKSGIGSLPSRVTWLHLYGVSALCGIGFTMSLFISSLAFEQGAIVYAQFDRLGILGGSIVSALLGYFVLLYSSFRYPESSETPPLEYGQRPNSEAPETQAPQSATANRAER